jgi:hypothetical protein
MGARGSARAKLARRDNLAGAVLVACKDDLIREICGRLFGVNAGVFVSFKSRAFKRAPAL